MTLIVETGAGLADAESYCSVAFADNYHTGQGRELEWSDLDDEVKEQALRRATIYMIGEYRMRWAGYRKGTTQSLDWPRYDVPQRDVPGGSYSAYYPYDSVPREVQIACAELAFRTRDSTPLAADQGRVTKSETVGPISVTYADGGRMETVYKVVDGLLAPFLNGSGTSMSPIRRS